METPKEIQDAAERIYPNSNKLARHRHITPAIKKQSKNFSVCEQCGHELSLKSTKCEHCGRSYVQSPIAKCNCTITQACAICAKEKGIDWSVIHPIAEETIEEAAKRYLKSCQPQIKGNMTFHPIFRPTTLDVLNGVVFGVNWQKEKTKVVGWEEAMLDYKPIKRMNISIDEFLKQKYNLVEK